MNNGVLLAAFGLVLTNLFWAGNNLFARAFSVQIASYDLNLLRWGLAIFMLTPIAIPYVKKDWHLLKIHYKKIILLGILSVSVFNFLLYQSAHNTQAINIGLINTLVPLFILLFSWPILKKKPNKIAFLCIMIGFLGAVIILLKGRFNSLKDVQLYHGDALMMMATVVWATYSVLLNKWNMQIHHISLLWSMMVIGLIALLTLMPFFGVPQIPKIGSSLSYVVIYMAIFPALFAYFFWNYGVSKIGVSTSALFIYLNPCFTAFLGVLIGQEILQNYHLIGGLLILISLITISMIQRKQYYE